jgi:hypothetical protein
VPRGKGINGETLAEAIKTVLARLGNRASAEEIFTQVRKMGAWTEDNIWQGLMEFVVNLPPSYRHWEGTHFERRFLFLREDGNYELYQPQWHGRYDQGKRIV